MSFGIRFRYSRDATLQYIAHLDMLRLFERALRRSALPVAHTQGFNPRMKLVFGLPMSIGLSSEAEYADIETDRPVPPDTFIRTLNAHLPPGMRVLEAVTLAGSDNVMGRVAAARYRMSVQTVPSGTESEMAALFSRLMEAERLPVMKKGKKGLREIDIRPLIFSATLHKGPMPNRDATAVPGQEFVLEIFISAGADDNLRPDLLVEAWSRLVSVRFAILSLHRQALYASVENEWLSLTDPRACGGHAS